MREGAEGHEKPFYSDTPGVNYPTPSRHEMEDVLRNNEFVRP